MATHSCHDVHDVNVHTITCIGDATKEPFALHATKDADRGAPQTESGSVSLEMRTVKHGAWCVGHRSSGIGKRPEWMAMTTWFNDPITSQDAILWKEGTQQLPFGCFRLTCNLALRIVTWQTDAVLLSSSCICLHCRQREPSTRRRPSQKRGMSMTHIVGNAGALQRQGREGHSRGRVGHICIRSTTVIKVCGKRAARAH